MARARKKWSHSVGRYGATVRITESRLGGILRWDYRDPETGRRTRPEVSPAMRVRHAKDEPVDPVLERKAQDRCEQYAAALTLQPLRKAVESQAITLGDAYRLFFEPRRRALPASKEGKVHHTASRKFWCAELGEIVAWDAIAPADVRAALVRLIEQGKVATAEKRLANLRTLWHWLVEMMGHDRLRNPTRGVDKKQLIGSYKPRRPRYTPEEVEALVKASESFGPRVHLFVVLLADSGARAVQVRSAMRSGLDCNLEPPPPAGWGPAGWLEFPSAKGQEPHLTALTVRQRKAINAALTSYLAEWDLAWRVSGRLPEYDYPLIPSGRIDQSRPRLTRQPISDNALRAIWAQLEEKAGIPRKARRAFHGSRRSWSDDIEQAEGLDTVTAAGGWAKRETVEDVYLTQRKFHHLERARQRREKK